MLKISEPIIIKREPYLVVGAYATYEGEDEGPGWSGAASVFFARKNEIITRKDEKILGFMYRPHKDHPEIAEDVKACFIGVDVTDLDHIPEGLSTTHFSGGRYVTVACIGDTQDEATMGVGDGVQFLENWIKENGYIEGDACFALSDENAEKPPFVEYVYMKIEKRK